MPDLPKNTPIKGQHYFTPEEIKDFLTISTPIKGVHYHDGKHGMNGMHGKDGKDGVNGKDGKHGRDGRNGRDGKDGKDGKNAKEVDVNEIVTKLSTLKEFEKIKEIDVLKNDVTNLRNSKQFNMNDQRWHGGGAGVGDAGLSASKAVITDSTSKLTSSATTSTELGYVSGVTSAIQTQLNGKQASLGFTPENVANKSTTTTLGTSDTLYPTQNAVKTYADTGLALKRNNVTTINSQSGTTYTLLLTDASKLVILTNAAPIALTIPTNGTVAFPVGTQIDFIQGGAGKVTFSGAGTTINSIGGFKSISAQWVGVSLIQTATDVWSLVGSLIL